MRDWTYRHYVANSLKLIPENKYLQPTLYDIMNPKPEDTRTAEEIIMDIMTRGGLKLEDAPADDLSQSLTSES